MRCLRYGGTVGLGLRLLQHGTETYNYRASKSSFKPEDVAVLCFVFIG